jgi:hypothetical protein
MNERRAGARDCPGGDARKQAARANQNMKGAVGYIAYSARVLLLGRWEGLFI